MPRAVRRAHSFPEEFVCLLNQLYREDFHFFFFHFLNNFDFSLEIKTWTLSFVNDWALDELKLLSDGYS